MFRHPLTAERWNVHVGTFLVRICRKIRRVVFVNANIRGETNVLALLRYRTYFFFFIDNRSNTIFAPTKKLSEVPRRLVVIESTTSNISLFP